MRIQTIQYIFGPRQRTAPLLFYFVDEKTKASQIFIGLFVFTFHKLSSPYSICADTNCLLWSIDSSNHRIERFKPFWTKPTNIILKITFSIIEFQRKV